MLLALATTLRPACRQITRNSLRFASSNPPRKRLRVSTPEKPANGEVEPDKWNYNSSSLLEGDAKTQEQLAAYPLVDANELERHEKQPKQVKMLVRDWIEDCLYNPHYGYFPKQAVIFDTQDIVFDFPRLRNSVDFQEEVGKRYAAYGSDEHEGPGRQIWHTPTELFKPWYGEAIARCLVAEYLLKYFPYEDFVIYEIGAGNGTLAMNILDFLKSNYPEVYDRTRYNIIEISGSLVKLQRKKLASVHPCVRVEHKSIFRWNKKEDSPCFVVAMEVIDNFAHDMVRYDLKTLEPLQALVTVDDRGDYDMIYSRVTDPLIADFLKLRRRLGHAPAIPRLLHAAPSLLRLYSNLPFAPNLSAPEYIPTRLLSLLRTLRTHFPRHRLLLSDFNALPEAIQGRNAPVVQTRFQNTTVPVTTLLVAPGFFDIFFPTNFERLRDMYEYILAEPAALASSLGADFFSSYHPSNRRHPVEGVTSASGLPVGERKSSVFTHAQFLNTYGDVEKTRLRNGENPMVEFYQNVKFLF
ncbi:Protein arginine methyltransferase NDUFAF7 [Mycena chlorophos]|uniref:Protein arginine methyltransferase NDUFAF7 n=1 Tax=Mycena chlorophos TaxID=658473 RepID=A0A8H6W9N5_MYCCL|nr:Protein arginine methyltransferase NDUFAF7 [Mycena chlorophos]